MRLKSFKKAILLTMIGYLALVGNFANAHGGGGHHAKPVHYKHVTHTYSHVQPVYKHYVKKVYVYPKKHYHAATAYVPAEYHAHAGGYPLHRHYYWKKPHYDYAYKKAHHH